ncbi:MAG: YqeG family HAD IIIA-type phosphatase [Clostridia bacterium]|nr:YqeG family HAD IIIA-type phosphatase [Clostridia bacterium]
MALSLLKARYRFKSVLDITAEDLRLAGAKAVLIDADNTLSFHGSQVPYPGVAKWLEKMKESGIPFVIISNNERERIEPFAEKLGLPFIEKSKKPLPFGFRRACKMLGVAPSETAVIGDQIFTDVLGGNLIGAKVFLTEPLGPDTDKYIKAKRHFEKWFR